MQQPKTQTKSKNSQINPGQSLSLIKEICREKNSSYPFHIVGDTYSDKEKGINFLIIIQLARQKNPMLIVYPFVNKSTKQYIKMQPINIQLQGLPERAASILKLQRLEYTISLARSSENIKINKIDFVIGYRAGYLLNVRYVNKEIKVLQRMNRMKNKQGFLTKATNYIFSDVEFYKTWAKGHVMKVIQHNMVKDRQKSSKAFYSYQIGKFIYIIPQMNEQIEHSLQQLYQKTNWNDPHLFQKPTSSILHVKTAFYKAIRNKQSVLIQFNNSPSCYQLSTNESCLFAARDNTLICIDINTLLVFQQISFQLSIRNINLAKSVKEISIQYILVMPYDDILFILELKNQKLVRYCKLQGHRAFIMQAMVDKGCVITAGADHRICITPISKIQTWEQAGNQKIDFFNAEKIQSNEKRNKYQKISRGEIALKNKKEIIHRIVQINENIEANKFKDIYSLGEYNNVRNNLYEYGFGDLMQLGNMYCFFNFDGKIKIFQI